MNLTQFSLLLTIALCISSCSRDTGDIPQVTDSNHPNILLIIADDLGKDAISGFTEGSVKPATPNIDSIRISGISFSNLWVNPTCTPTRSSIITGKYGYRTNVKSAGDELASSELTLQQYISDNTSDEYASAVIGKWHLSGNNSNINPESYGIDYYAGLIRGVVDDYYKWQLSEDGSSTLQNTYITETFTELAANWVNQQSDPWFLWLAYTAPHTPFHVPPAHTHSQGNLPEFANGMDPTPYYMAAIESMDYYVGELLDTIPVEDKENLIIIFIGDNGTPNQVAQSPYSSSKVKNTLYQGGINTPMFVSGQGVLRLGTDDNLICVTDLFATIAEIAGVEISEINDSKSFRTLLSEPSQMRTYQYSEMDDGINDQWTIRNEKYKLFVDATGNEEMYDLINDPYELTDLLSGNLTLEESEAKSELESELQNIRK